jgi:predicted Zn-ribbon and HTH transcriptional regulator
MTALPASGDGTKMPRCPHCDSELIDRIARHGLGDYLHFLFGRFPFSCRRCGQEFYLTQRNAGGQR